MGRDWGGGTRYDLALPSFGHRLKIQFAAHLSTDQAENLFDYVPRITVGTLGQWLKPHFADEPAEMVDIWSIKATTQRTFPFHLQKRDVEWRRMCSQRRSSDSAGRESRKEKYPHLLTIIENRPTSRCIPHVGLISIPFWRRYDAAHHHSASGASLKGDVADTLSEIAV